MSTSSPAWLTHYLSQALGHTKSLPPEFADRRLGEVAKLGLNVAAGNLPSPVMVIRNDALDHNIAAMAEYCRLNDLSLAPHGKTTMSPQIFHRQLQQGAWAMTAANWRQADVMQRHGVPRVILANELVDPLGIAWVAKNLRRDTGYELFVLADSVEAVHRLDDGLSEAGASRRLKILLEVGVQGGRAGVRDHQSATEVLAAIADCPSLTVAGVECFEGIIGPGREDSAVDAVDELLTRLVETAQLARDRGDFATAEEVVLSAGGSVFFDRVETLRRASTDFGRPVRVVLRSGCYVTHDSGTYEELSPLGRNADGDPGSLRLRPAMELWSLVLSRPEPGLAILDFGRRDAPFDSGLPVPLRLVRREAQATLPTSAIVRSMNDQHAMVEFDPSADIRVSDRIVLGISHPCTAFDKWQLIPVVNENDDVIEMLKTHFY